MVGKKNPENKREEKIYLEVKKTMAEAKILSHEEQRAGNIFSHLPKFQVKFPFFNLQKKASPPAESVVVKEGELENNGNQKPNFVSFPNTHQIVSPPLGVELQESSGRTHNPIVIWQVYAVGGFFILKWVWARWKERKGRAKKSAENDNQSSDEYQSLADENDQL